jgi:hypothetical protein
MLVESEKYQAKELPKILADNVTNVWLLKSMREEEQRRKNLPKLERRRWSGSELVVEDPISPGDIRKRSSGGGKEGEGAVRRRAEAPACRKAMAAAFLLCSSVQQ